MQNIKDVLNKTEKEQDIQILFACETGSRAWGFPSPDSDYDVRFIYAHELDWYLTLSEKRNFIEHMDGDLDISGWDLKKALGLLRRSNAALIERFNSPIVYSSDEKFTDEFRKLINVYYSPTAVFYHHYSLASKFRGELVDAKAIKLKSYFYLVRSLLSCNWIVQSNEPAPMNIEKLMTLCDFETKDILRSLIKVKSGKGEKYLHPLSREMADIVDMLFSFIETKKEILAVNDTDHAQLDAFFKNILYGKDNYRNSEAKRLAHL